MSIYKDFTPNDAGDVTDWFTLHGDYTVSVRSTTPNSPAGAGVVRLERKERGASDDTIEQVTTITAAAGTAAQVTGSERIRGMVHRLRCTTYTTAGAVYVLRGSGLIDQ